MTRRVDYLVGEEDFGLMTATTFMEEDVIYFSKNSKAVQLAMAMTSGGFGSVPIVDQNKKLVGIVSEFDLLKALRKGKDLSAISAEDIMTDKPISVSQDAKVDEIMGVLEEKKLIRVPVLDKKGKLVGVVARRDILQGYIRSRGKVLPWWM